MIFYYRAKLSTETSGRDLSGVAKQNRPKLREKLAWQYRWSRYFLWVSVVYGPSLFFLFVLSGVLWRSFWLGVFSIFQATALLLSCFEFFLLAMFLVELSRVLAFRGFRCSFVCFFTFLHCAWCGLYMLFCTKRLHFTGLPLPDWFCYGPARLLAHTATDSRIPDSLSLFWTFSGLNSAWIAFALLLAYALLVEGSFWVCILIFCPAMCSCSY